MANSVNGRVIAVNREVTVASSDPNKAPLRKREIYIDCTKYDLYTGERSEFENKILLEFGGTKVLEKVNPKLDQIGKNDIVSISFELQGRPYTDKATGKLRVITGVRCYDIAIVRKAAQNGQQMAVAAQQPQPQPQQYDANPTYQAPPTATSPFVNDDANDNGGLPF